MANVSKGGITASGKGRDRASVGGSASDLRLRFDEEGKATQTGVVFQGNCDHLWLRSPQPLFDAQGQRIGQDKGLYVDFGGIGKTQEYDMNLASHAKYVNDLRAVIDATPVHDDVAKYKIREVKPEEPAIPFSHFDEWAPDSLKIAILSKLGNDHDQNVRLVKEIARYEIANLDRSDVLSMLDALLATEASVSDAFEVEVSLV